MTGAKGFRRKMSDVWWGNRHFYAPRNVNKNVQYLLSRVNGIKKIVRRRNHDVELLKRRLDKHGDDWRSVPMEAPHPKGKTEQKRRGPKPKNKQAADETGAPGSEPGPNTPAARKPRKQKAKQAPINPNPVIAPPHQQPQPPLLTWVIAIAWRVLVLR